MVKRIGHWIGLLILNTSSSITLDLQQASFLWLQILRDCLQGLID
jgi:hypothetical protein